MKRTNTKEFHGLVMSHLIAGAYDCEDMTESDVIAHTFNRFQSEYNYAQNRIRIPNTQARVAEWLSGLALSVAYTYHDIIVLSEQWHGCTLSEKERDRACKQWFSMLAMHLMRAWRKQGLHPYA